MEASKLSVSPLKELTVVKKKHVQQPIEEPWIETKEAHMIARHNKKPIHVDAATR